MSDEKKTKRQLIEELIRLRKNDKRARETISSPGTEKLLVLQRNLVRALSSIHDLHKALNLILKTILKIESIDSGGVYLVNQKIKELDLIVHKGLSQKFVDQVSHYAQDSAQVKLVLKGRPVYGHFSEISPQAQTSLFKDEKLKALVIIPIKDRKNIVAVLNLASHTHDHLPQSARHALESIAAQIGGLIARIRAEDNLQKFNKDLEKIIEQRSQNLRESEERFRQMAENIREVFWLFDWIEQKVIYVSPAYENIWARSREKLYNRYEEWGESIDPRDKEFARESFEKAVKTRGGAPREYRIIRPDKTIRWISDRVFPIKNANGKVYRVTGIAEDITEQKRAEELREKIIRELQEALENVTTLRGLIPICASCKKIRDDEGFWNQVETYISKYSQVQFTHGICPECTKKAYVDLKKQKYKL